jgi:predicted transcriptional regulator
LTNSSNGTLSYHIAQLEQSKRIIASRKKGVTRYYPAHISTEISKIIGYIRNPVSRQIIAILLKNNGCTQSQLTTLTEKAPSTVSWHLQKLVNGGVVIKNSVSDSNDMAYRSIFYHVSDKPMVEDVMSKYVESSIDRAINHYTALMDELR